MYPSDVNSIFRSSRVAGSGLKAMRGWMNIISNNISNANSVDTGRRTGNGNFVPYARQIPVFAKVLSEKFRENNINGDVLNGVQVKRIATLNGDVRKVYDPAHPAARRAGTFDAGYVYYPNISSVQEMADMKVAAASYEANLSVIDISQRMMQQALQIGKK